MGKRTKQRTKMVLPVRVWGMDSSGKPFTQLAHTLDINRTGARIGGFRGLLALGDVIGIQYRHMKARFRVVWVARPGSSQESQVGVECLEHGKDVWGLEMPEQKAADDFQPPTVELDDQKSYGNRSDLRFRVSGSAEVRTPDGVNTGGQVVDISLRGCYVETMAPMKARTSLSLRMRLEGHEMELAGVVRTCHPGVGMGVEFIDDRSVNFNKLKALVQKLQDSPRPSASARPKPDSPYLAQRLQQISNDLRDVDDLLKTIHVDPTVLREFRGALGHVRNTSWAVQRWVELQGNKDDPFPVLVYLNTERIRLATQLCRSLHDDLEVAELELQKLDLQELLRVVEVLFASLASMDFDLMEMEEDEEGRLRPRKQKVGAESEA